jgi:hypothetical protein
MAINKTKAGTFAVDFRDRNRKRIQRTFPTHKGAVAFEKEVLAKVQSGDYIAPSQETVKVLAQRWWSGK